MLSEIQFKFLRSIDTPTVCNLIEIVAPERRGAGYTAGQPGPCGSAPRCITQSSGRPRLTSNISRAAGQFVRSKIRLSRGPRQSAGRPPPS